MSTSLTSTKIADTYTQLLHIDEGPTAEEKTVYSGDGTATALKLGTQSASVDNLRLDGNTISPTNANGDVILTPNGTGKVTVSNINVLSGTIPFSTLTGRAYAYFYPNLFNGLRLTSNSNYYVKFSPQSTPVAGFSLIDNGTKITFDVGGVYDLSINTQFSVYRVDYVNIFVAICDGNGNILGNLYGEHMENFVSNINLFKDFNIHYRFLAEFSQGQTIMLRYENRSDQFLFDLKRVRFILNRIG